MNTKDRSAAFRVFALLVLISVFSQISISRDGETEAGTQIVNQASARYEDPDGRVYMTVSSTVTVTVVAVPALSVTPDETSPSDMIIPNFRVTRLFRICNSGNTPDRFLPIDARITPPATIDHIYFDVDKSGTITPGDTPVIVGETLSNELEIGACVGVLYDIQAGNVTPGTQVVIRLTARSSQLLPSSKTYSQDDGTIINDVGEGVILTSPNNPNLPPLKLVEGESRYVAVPGQTLNYKIMFRNRGSVPAFQVRVTDDLPAELDYVANTLRLDNRTLTDGADSDEGSVSGRRLEFLIPAIESDAVTVIEFQARLIAAVPNGNGVVNFADLSALNAPEVRSTDAVVIVNPVGVVYAGNSGGSVRIADARLTLATDETGTPLSLNPKFGFSVNPDNANPFTSNGNGEFSFGLASDQIGEPNAPERYVLTAQATNYRSRQIELMVVPAGGTNGFFEVTVRALDGQAVAVANGFQLTEQTVLIENLGALVFNVPMFDLSTLNITKSADKSTAQIGDIVTYRVTVKNSTASPIENVDVNDTLPPAFSYAAGTARLENGGNTEEIEPAVNGDDLVFEIGTLEPGSIATVTYRVRVGANAPEGTVYNSAFARGIQLDGTEVTTPTVRAGVRINAGLFSMSQMIIGRVFEDRNANGKLDKGERPVVGARIFSTNGQSVITDSAGLYHFPTTGSGSIVLSLDPVTLPPGYMLLDDRNRRSSKGWTRLLRTPLGGGAMLRQNFAIAPRDDVSAIPDNSSKVIASGSFVPPVQNADKTDKPKEEKPVQIADLNKPVAFNQSADADKKETKSTETFTVGTTETIEPIKPGAIRIISPEKASVIMEPALSIVAQVANNWTIETEVNGQKIENTSIGETRVDNRNQITTYSFVGINIHPGVNTVRLTAIGENDERGETASFDVLGRGPATKLEIVPAKNSVSSDGREALPIEIRAFDRFGNPAADSQIAVGTSAGKFYVAPTGDAKTESGKPQFPKQQSVSLSKGRGTVYLLGENSTDTARVKAVSGTIEATADIRFTAELRPALLVGVGEFALGRTAPDITNAQEDALHRGRIAFFYRGRILGDNLLTLAYDSQNPLNRVAGRDRVGALDPLENAYPIFGDSSLRSEGAQSNSKIYARIDRGRSYAMFGDMETDMNQSALAGYSRRLTGAKVHIENAQGDFVSVSGARPDTAFSRDVFPGGGLSLFRLAHGELLPGSDVVALEVRDRRNPEIILSRENLIRSVDYNLDSVTGEIFLLRPISTFDYGLNLIQIVVTYEYFGVGTSNSVYTARGLRNMKKMGLRVGTSYVIQQQGEIGSFQIGGIDAEKTLWNGGRLSMEAAMSRGRFAAGVNVFDFYNENTGNESEGGRTHNGNAFFVKLDQPLPFWNSRLRADFARADAGFYNPFGATVTPGSQRLGFALEIKPTSRRSLVFGFLNESNKTVNVDNYRNTFSIQWSEQWNNKTRTVLGFDRRKYQDNLTDTSIGSNLVTAGIEYRPTDKIEISAKREQNLTEADSTYPDQTTFAIKYKLNANAKLFVTQRLAASAITPIGDFSGNGFASVGARNETAFGIETKLPFVGAFNGRYQIENGVNGFENFAVIGLQNRWKLNEKFALETGLERGFLLKGSSKSFNSATFGGEWTPAEGFRANGRYELRDRNGLGQLFALGAAGKIGENWTTSARAQWAFTNFNNRAGSSSSITSAFAYRPVESDKYAILFSYNHRESYQKGIFVNDVRQADIRDVVDRISADGLYQINDGLELYGKFALNFNGNGNNTNVYASNLTYLMQARVQQRLTNMLDVAVESRWLVQPASGSYRRTVGSEIGFWILPDLRIGPGYNFSFVGSSHELESPEAGNFKKGMYLIVTTKISSLFNLFGTSKDGLASEPGDETQETPVNIAENKRDNE